MKWLKKLLGFGEFTPTPAPTAVPADAGAKAFDQMAKTLSAVEEKKAAVAQDTKEVVAEAAAPVVVPEVQATEVKVEEVVAEAPKPKAPRKPRAKKEPVVEPVAPLPQTVAQSVEQWPFPNDKPAEGAQKPKPAARSVKAK